MPSIRVELLPGRSANQKKEFAEVVTRETCRIFTCSPDAVEIIFVTVEKGDWAVAGKLLSEPEG